MLLTDVFYLYVMTLQDGKLKKEMDVLKSRMTLDKVHGRRQKNISWPFPIFIENGRMTRCWSALSTQSMYFLIVVCYTFTFHKMLVTSVFYLNHFCGMCSGDDFPPVSPCLQACLIRKSSPLIANCWNAPVNF